MSIKTLRKRIALVAVSALGAGLMSVVAAPVASAAVAANETGYIASSNSTTGASVIDVAAIENALSLGLISTTGTVANGNVSVTAGSSITGNILATGELAATTDSATKAAISVSGGVIIARAGTAAPTINSSATFAVAANTGDAIAVRIKPTGAVGSTVTITFWNGANLAANTAETSGAISGTATYTVVATGASQVYSAADSELAVQAQKAKGTACSTTNAAYDDVATIRNGYVACILVNPKDAYGQAVTSGTVTASATNSAKVLVSAANAAAGYIAAAPFSSATSAANLYVAVVQATANVGQSTTVTITWNGVVIGTKTITFQGDIAKLTFVASSSKTVYKNGATNAAADGARLGIVYAATDALGQAVTLSAGPTISDATGAMTAAVLDNTNDGTIGVVQTAALGYGAAAMTIASNPLVGAGTYRLKVTNAAGVDIKSDVINATVSGGAASFTAAWNKASYVPGEVAELTITAKDSGGRPVAQGLAFGTGAAITVNTDGLTSLTAGCDNLATQTISGADGSRVCKFAVKNTAGSYSYSVAVPTSSSQAAVTGSVKITTDAISNAEVLASIVKLIAAINKQIRALQKSLKR